MDTAIARAKRGRPPDFSAVRGRRLLIALSGGADSVALLAMLSRAREEYGLTLFAAHLDHGIRPESAGDAEACRALCARLDIPFHTVRLDVPAEAARAGEGLESCARRLRYGWLQQVKDAVRADYIALAHHMDDQAETVLMHLARGTGPEGIGGMRTFAGDLYRPLLGVRKAWLTAYLAGRGIPWREDRTNVVADNPRNALRLDGIPALERAYPGFVPAAARYAHAAQIESDYIQEQTDVYIREHIVQLPSGTYFGLFSGLHPAILRRALRAFAGERLDWAHLNAAAELAERPRGRASLAGGLSIERGRAGLYLLHNRPKSVEVPLRLGGDTALDGLCTLTASPCAPAPVRDDPMRQALDPEALRNAVVRTRRPGDRIRPLGCGEKLLSDYLTDRRIDRPLRDCLALVARDNRVLWVCGVGISEDAKLCPGAREALALCCDYAFDLRRLLPGFSAQVAQAAQE